MKEFESQSLAIRKFLEEGNAITGMVALEKFGCWSLPRRICDLKEIGIVIESQWIKTDSGKRIKQYWIANDDEGQPDWAQEWYDFDPDC